MKTKPVTQPELKSFRLSHTGLSTQWLMRIDIFLCVYFWLIHQPNTWEHRNPNLPSDTTQLCQHTTRHQRYNKDPQDNRDSQPFTRHQQIYQPTIRQNRYTNCTPQATQTKCPPDTTETYQPSTRHHRYTNTLPGSTNTPIF